MTEPSGPALPIADLPADLELDMDAAKACPRRQETPPERYLWLIPGEGSEGPDLLAVASDAKSSAAGWRMSDGLIPGLRRESVELEKVRDAWIVLEGSRALPASMALLGEGPDESLLWLIDCGAYEEGDLESASKAPSALAILEVEDADAITSEAHLWARVEDWSGDGETEVLLELGRAEVRRLYARGDGGPWVQVMELDSESLIVDLDRDGRLYAVSASGEDRWEARTWTGDRVVSRRLEDRGIQPPVVDPAMLPVLPMDLYFTQLRGSQELVLRWPAGGGPLEPVDADLVSRISWEPLDRHDARSGDVREDEATSMTRRAYLVDDDIDSTPVTVAAPEDIPGDATRHGAIHLVDGTSADLDGMSLVPVYTRENEEFGVRRFMGLRLDASGRRLAWSDGVGLWDLEVLEGRPRLLATWEVGGTGVPEEDWVFLQYPDAWSPDGRYLLVENAHYVEGGSLAVWDVEAESIWLLPDSVSYADGHSDAGWLRSGRLLHARSGFDFGGQAWMRLLNPADRTSSDLLPPLWPRSHGMATAGFLGFAERPDGSIVFGMRSNLPFDAMSNGFFLIQPDGSDLTRIAGLPTETDPDGNSWNGGGIWCRMRFAPDSSLFICHDRGSSTPHYLVGSVDSGQLWDATAIFESPEHGQIHEIAFGAP